VRPTGAAAFDITPEEALPCAERLLEYLRATGKRPSIEKPAWSDSPYRTTLAILAGSSTILYEVQGTLDWHNRLVNFTQWMRANRKSAELFLVSDAASPTTAALFSDLRRSGTGLMLLRDDGMFEIALAARNPALQVTPDPDLKLGSLKAEVLGCVEKFNTADRKDALRDLCEVVERETKKTVVHAARKGALTILPEAVERQDFATQINTLSSKNLVPAGKVPLIDTKLKDDLHSFRGARNLVDHPCATKRAEQQRQRQFPERMMMGARLVADLLSIRRKIR
jgi:hypothetical protein